MAEKETLPLDRIATESTQARAVISETVIGEYAEALKRGDEFPPVDVYFDGERYWLADGFHRLKAAARAGREYIDVIVHQGGNREALLHAVGANETHGHRRTDADRRHAIRLMLTDEEWREWNNSEIARQCRVSEHFVRTIRSELEPAKETKETLERTRKVTRGGKTYGMRTGKIGGASPRKPKTPAVVTALGQEPTPVSSTRSKIDAPAAASPQEPMEQSWSVETPDAPPEPHAAAPAPAMNGEQTVTLEISAQPLAAAEPQIEPDAHRPDVVTSHVETAPTDEPGSSPGAAAHTEGLLAHTWDAATHEERQVFVALRRDELQVFLSALDSPKRAAQPRVSAATRRATPPSRKQQGRKR